MQFAVEQCWLLKKWKLFIANSQISPCPLSSGRRSCGLIPEAVSVYLWRKILWPYTHDHIYPIWHYTICMPSLSFIPTIPILMVTLPGEQNSTVPVSKGAAIAVAWTSNLGPSYLSGAIIIFTMQLLITNYNIPEYELTRLRRCVSSYLATFSPLSSSSVSTQL